MFLFLVNETAMSESRVVFSFFLRLPWTLSSNLHLAENFAVPSLSYSKLPLVIPEICDKIVFHN